MAQEQFGICAEANLHGLFLMFNAHDGREAYIRESLAKLTSIFDEISEQFSESMVSTVIAIGANYWNELYPAVRPKLLRSFPAIEHGDITMPAVPYDLMIQIRSDRADVNHLAGLRVCALLSNAVELVEQIRGFRYLDGRDLTGFVNGTGNPKGRRKREVALVSKEQDPEFENGSYLHVQRYRHQLTKWESLDVSAQEEVIGRSKIDNQEMNTATKPIYSHTSRVNMLDEHGQKMEILRQSMPYGHMKVQGLFFISCCHTPEHFELMLNSMVCTSAHNKNADQVDNLLEYTQAETGAAFFAPSVNFIESYSATYGNESLE
ncbi:Dyp-type peroxidase [Flocculibacter collagenilyticus]|uniref:Dyp-type peroxidase n=1 Tax=Flocculibacter collagenilyticus TaxID=2744479 RepID=UPI0018F4688E|nr:Dyp-type peroxidase [Flocculibacter collagenilyticus]